MENSVQVMMLQSWNNYPFLHAFQILFFLLFSFMKTDNNTILNEPLNEDDMDFIVELQKAFLPHHSKYKTLQVCLATYSLPNRK